MLGIRSMISRAISNLISNSRFNVLNLAGDRPFNKNTNTVFIDRSVNDFAVTRAGDAAQNTSSYSPFSTSNSWSYYFDSVAARLVPTASANFAFGTGDFTIECWIFSHDVSNTAQRGFLQTSVTSGGLQTTYTSGVSIAQGQNAVGNPLTGGLVVNVAGTFIGSNTAVLSANTWYHVAVSRQSGTVRVFVNGILHASGTAAGDCSGTNLVIGGYYSTTYLYKGLLSNVRIVKGTALYTSAFTPPTTNLPAVSGTSILTCSTATLTDASSNAVNIVVTGSPAASTLAPFDRALLAGTNGDTSVFFPGSSSYLSVPSSSGFDFAAGDFTIELFAYRTGTGTGDRFLVSRGNGANFLLRWNAAGNLQFFINSSLLMTYAYSFPTNSWIHIAISRAGSANKMFINGVQVATATDTTTISNTANPVLIGGYSSSDYFQGNISNLRITKGSAVYTAGFTPPTGRLEAIPGTSLLTCTGSTITDSSTSNTTITVTGASVRVSGLNPFNSNGGWSGYFDGNGDYLTVPGNTAFDFGIGDFTVEGWWFTGPLTATAMQPVGYHAATAAAGADVTFGITMSSSLCRAFFYSDSTQYNIDNWTASVAVNRWQHFALVRQSGTVRFYLDGVQVGTVSANVTLNYSASWQLRIGNYADNANRFWNGFLSNIRVVKGTCLYNNGTTFAPPSSQLSAVTGTSLLALQDNTFKDNSNNSFTITPYGDAAVRPHGPFTNTNTLFPGSIYFDGANDYLTVPASTNTNLLGGDFTVECWYYPITIDGTNFTSPLISQNDGSTASNFHLTLMPGGTVRFYSWQSSVSGSVWFIASTSTVKLGSWNHIAVSHVRSSNTTRLFINGALAVTGTTPTWTGGSRQTALGNYSAGSAQTSTYSKLNGYMSGVRLTKGTALYTTSFTPSLSVPLPSANTALLLNFNDGGVVDAYGNSSTGTFSNSGVVSEANIKKYGSGSLYFNNTSLVSAQRGEYVMGGDFTIEFWLNSVNASNSSRGIIQITNTAPSNFAPTNEGVGICFAASQTNGLLNFFIGGVQTTGTINATNGAWVHVALCRSGSTVRLFVGGVLSVKTTNSTALPGRYLTVGAANGLAYGLVGYLDNVQIYNGYAKYTSDATFVPE